MQHMEPGQLMKLNTRLQIGYLEFVLKNELDTHYSASS